MDPNSGPWRAVGKLQANASNLHSACTGTLIAPATVLTAAHCLINPRTQAFFLPSSIHFLIGYARGEYAGHAKGVAFVIAPGFDSANPAETYGSDWALLTLDQKLGTPDRVLDLGAEPAVGTSVLIGGYGYDQPLLLMAGQACKIIGHTADAKGRRLLQHNCAAVGGVSGAPLLAQVGMAWQVIGVDVAGYIGATGGVAAIVER